MIIGGTTIKTRVTFFFIIILFRKLVKSKGISTPRIIIIYIIVPSYDICIDIERSDPTIKGSIKL